MNLLGQLRIKNNLEQTIGIPLCFPYFDTLKSVTSLTIKDPVVQRIE